MDEMRQGIGLRAIGQSDPLVAYKREAHDMWGQLLANIRRQVSHSIFHVEVTQRRPQPARTATERRGEAVAVGAGGSDAKAAAAADGGGGGNGGAAVLATGKARKIGRNQPCPCGSGKKYKKCHGMAA